MATVFSAPPTSYTMFPVLITPGLRMGVAVANDNDVTANFTMQFTDSAGHITGRVVAIPARSQYVHYLDEILTLPTAPSTGSFEIISQFRSSAQPACFSLDVFLARSPHKLSETKTELFPCPAIIAGE